MSDHPKSEDTAMYLREVRINNFRSYGPDFCLQLPDGPGVTLLSGPNGLGKTSLFEAIEWALTARVRRLDEGGVGEIDPADLARRASGVDGCEVNLRFQGSGATDVRRSLPLPRGANTAPPVVGVPVEQVVSILSRDAKAWGVSEESISSYLHVTHFLPQASVLRLVLQKPKTRWNILSQIAGSWRLEIARTHLSRVKRAMTTLCEEREGEAKQAEESLEAWQLLLNEEKRLDAEAQSLRDALEPGDAARQLSRIFSSLGIKRGPPPPDDADSLLDEIGELRRIIAERRERLSQTRATIDRARADTPKWIKVGVRRDQLRTQLQEHRNHQAECTRSHLATSEVAASATAAAETATKARERAAARLDSVSRIVQIDARISSFRDQRTELHQALARGSQLQADLQGRFATAQSRLEAIQRAERDNAATRNALADVTKAAEAGLQVEAILRQIHKYDVELEALDQQAQHLSNERSAADARRTQQQGALEQAERSRAAIAKTVTRLQDALVLIAGHITASDEKCPVCQTRFKPGELHSLAASSASEIATGLIEADEALEQQRHRLVEIEADLAAIERRSKSVFAARRSIEQSKEVARASIARLGEAPLLKGLSPESWPAAVSDAEAKLKTREAELHAIREELGPRDAAEEAFRNARVALEEANATVKALTDRFDSQVELLQRSEVEIGELLRTLSANNVADVDARFQEGAKAALRDAIRAEEAASAAEAAARRSLADASEALRRSTEAIAVIEHELTQSDKLLDDLRSRWGAHGFAGEPSEVTLEAEAERYQDTSHLVTESDKLLQDVAGGLSRWREFKQLREVRNRMAGLLDGGTPEQVTARLISTLEGARKAAQSARLARSSADDLAEHLRAKSEVYAEQVLSPLKSVFTGYVRALVQDERFHDIGVEAKVQARSGTVAFPLPFEGDGYDSTARAEYILSEGQLSDLSLAVLLAASTSYRWSRWNALLLDDPTQYNDLVHATAILEVIRGLVQQKGYQIILSTHDDDQADFFLRKLKSSKINAVECRYLAIGANGVSTSALPR